MILAKEWWKEIGEDEEQELNRFVDEKMKQYVNDRQFKVETKYGNTYVFCKEYDYMVEYLDQRLRKLFDIVDIKYAIQRKIGDTNFSFILIGEDQERAAFIQKFIDDGYVLKWK